MESWREQYLGVDALPASLTRAEVAFFFEPTEQTLPFVETRRRPLTRLGLLLHIGFLRMTGRPLAALERIPSVILEFVADHAGVPAPQIATLRAIYRRRMTLFAHQRLAAEAIGWRTAEDGVLRMLTAFLRRQAETEISRPDLVRQARRWLYDRSYVLPGERLLERMAATAQDYVLDGLKSEIEGAVGAEIAASWAASLSGAGPNGGGVSLLDWLRAPTQGFGRNDIRLMQARIVALRGLGAERLALPNLTLDRIRNHAARIARRKAATLSRLSEPRRTVEIGCWLRLQLLEATDAVLMQTSRRIGQLWSQARDAVEARALHELKLYRSSFGIMVSALDNRELSNAEFREVASSAMQPLRTLPATKGRAAAIRVQMGEEPSRLRALMQQVSTLPIDVPADHPLKLALDTLADKYANRDTKLREWELEPFLRSPSGAAISVGNTNQRFAAFEVATAMLLKRALRNGAASARHSIHHRSVADQLLPASIWANSKARALRNNGWPVTIEAYLRRFKEPLALRMEMLAEAISDGEIGVANDRFQVPRLPPVSKDPAVDATRTDIFGRIGSVQLPEVMVSIDEQARFSGVLLGRDAARRAELETLYAALLALGSDKTAADMARMMDGVSDDRIELMMRTLEENGQFRTASDRVAAAMLENPIARLWGSGVVASADMMSMDATRHLWLARIEPRRRTPAVGTYTHVVDQWAIIYDQPVLLNLRQAGVAIEGALNQKVCELQRLAVDTHGFTHFAMAAAKLLGFDLAPRLADLATRKLYLPHDVSVPQSLEPMVVRVKISRLAKEGWDGLLHVIMSLKSGHSSAATIIDRHGSAARGTATYEAGTLLGKVLRSLFLLDYLVKPDFRREVHRNLSQGESVHQLQRAILAGRIEAKHGRKVSELAAVSGALTLLTNIVMAWNTAAMQQVVDANPGRYAPEHFTHIAPVAFRHINMHGKLYFPIREHERPRLDTAQ